MSQMLRALLLSAALVASAGPALAQAVQVTHPNIAADAGPATVRFEGRTYVDKGLVAVGRLPADSLDFAGETLGSFSAMAVESWRRLPDGTYAGTLLTLPDRGPNDVGAVVGTTNYRNRLERLDITLAPAAGKLGLKPVGGLLLKDLGGQTFTGRDPGAHTVVEGGVSLPSPESGAGAGHVSLDSEGLARLPDGSFYVSDEYAAGIYYFDKDGGLTGVIPAVPAIAPRVGGAVNFGAAKSPESGRRNNQGLEALALSPDGKRLFALLQSATVQDTGPGHQGRSNTRILVYDISAGRTPVKPIGHYVLQLPQAALTGETPNATAALSDAQALDDHRLLVLSRDNIGRGGEPKGATIPVFKSILLVDLAGATNLTGTAYETEPTGAVSPRGVLDAKITPARQVELVNLLNPGRLARFGMNLKTAPSDPMSLSEKWESMALVPALDPKAPDDAFLLVGNDNDFLTGHLVLNGATYDAAVKGEGGTGDNDNVILAFRLTLPRAK